MSADALLLKAFLSFVFCLVVNNDSCGRTLASNIFKQFLKSFLYYLSLHLLIFLVEHLITLHLPHYIQPFICTIKHNNNKSNNNNNNDNNNNNNNENDNGNGNDNNNENDLSNIFNLH